MAMAALAATVVGCEAAPPAVGDHRDDLAIREQLDRSPDPIILGSSADRRLVAYGIGCEGGPDQTAEARLADAWTGEITRLGPIRFCMPGSVKFSPNGQLLAFGDGQGGIFAYSLRTRRRVQLSPADRPSIGVDWSPDSRWLIVASEPTEGPFGSALEAWDANLVDHVTIADHAFYSPFPGPPFQNVRFSPDGQQLLYIDNLGPGVPVGALTIWNRATGRHRQLATGVLVTGYVINDDWQRIAWQRGITYVPGEPPPQWQHGPIEVFDVATGAVETVEADSTGTPVAFTRGAETLVYQVATSFGPPTPTLDLRTHVIGGGNQTIDSGILPAYGGPAAAIVVHPRGEIAYVTGFDPRSFSGTLRLAVAPGARSSGRAPITIADHVVPQAFGFVGDDRALTYLHDPQSTFPGASLGTLSAYLVASGRTVDLGQNVTQINLQPNPASDNLLFVADYDMAAAAGTLSSWNARSRTVKSIIDHAAVINFQTSPDGLRVGAIQVTVDPAGQNPPSLALAIGWVRGPLPASTVAPDVRSFVLGDFGRVTYTTPTGLDAAWVF